MTFPSITNRGEFFSNHYLDAIIGGDLGDIRSRWDYAEAHDKSTPRSRLRSLPKAFFDARAAVADAGAIDRIDAVRHMHDVVLDALGFTAERAEQSFTRATVDTLRATTAARVDTPTGLHLVAIEGGMADDVDDLFAKPDGERNPAGDLLDPCERESEKKQVTSVPDAVNEFFALDEPPRFVLMLGGAIVLLAERAKWAEGRYLAVDLDSALERHDTKAKGELETIAALFSADALVPDDGQAVIDELVDNSHKHAVGVSKELRNGIRESIEILANEVIQQRWELSQRRHDRRLSSADANDLTRQCLRYLYRLLVLLYAESRPELGILPVNDQAYVEGYSLDRLRELVLVELDTDAARNGSHLHQSLTLLFELVNNGYHSEHATQQFVFDVPEEGERSHEEHLVFPGLDAALFDPRSTHLLDEVTLRNEALQRVLSLLMLSPEGKGRRKRSDRGFISYAQLGINQLGAVYEGLMSYTGFFADDDLYEVAKNGDPTDGTWVLPVKDADEYPDDVFVTRIDDLTGEEERVHHPKGSFVFRLSGRDRQRSASYYTPEVLTQCVVKHALAELLGTDDYAPENGSSGIKEGEAVKILDLTICEPALGSGAFANEAINQLSAEYLKRRQAELGETLDPEAYLRELQKVKAHFALHQTYGVDLNHTAIELAEVSLWLNAMYPGLKAPWFGLQLRRGNSLIGCRRATWRTGQIPDRPWVKTRKGEVQPPVDRKLSDGKLDPDEIHHFLFPGHGWAAVADRKEAKELREDEVAELKAWRKAILAAPKKADAKRLSALAEAVEDTWAAAEQRIRLIQQALRRPIDVYGADVAPKTPISRGEAERALRDPDSPLGRLRTLMDAWVGLWFWPLDTGVRPPSWEQWLHVAEELVRPDERRGPSGQLPLFDDLSELIEAQDRLTSDAPTVAEIRQSNRWLSIATGLAQREGAWHWELDFAPAFRVNGGFDLQVGNPPWTKLYRTDTGLGEDLNPHWAFSGPPAGDSLLNELSSMPESDLARYLTETANSEATRELLSSPCLRASTRDMMVNLYLLFMDNVWRNAAQSGASGLIHPESHFTDSNASRFRSQSYARLRRHWMFYNELKLFEDVHNATEFGVHIYGTASKVGFLNSATLLHPNTLQGSIGHNGIGDRPAQQYESGGRDLRPHASRVQKVELQQLSDWAALFEDSSVPPDEVRLIRPVTSAELQALSSIARVTRRMDSEQYLWSSGLHETGAQREGIIRRETARADSFQRTILQGPHLSVATSFFKEPNKDCRNNRDYSEIDLESIAPDFVPRTNYQINVSDDEYSAGHTQWGGRSSTSYVRIAWRRMSQPSSERSLQAALLPPGPSHVHTVHSLTFENSAKLASFAGLLSSIPYDYLIRVSAVGDITHDGLARLPFPDARLLDAVALRSLRLNCITDAYAQVWLEALPSTHRGDRWALRPDVGGREVGDVEREWQPNAALRRESERRCALVELDALAAVLLGISAEQLCALYQAHFAVLRKYEYNMTFDAEGRRIAGHHHAAGIRQNRLQTQAKAGALPPEWKSIWKLYEQYEQDPDSVDWLGLYTPPFTRPDREAEMTRAYNEFQRRLDAGEYE